VQVTQGGGSQDLYEIVPELASWLAFATVRYDSSEYEVDGHKNVLLTNGATQIDHRQLRSLTQCGAELLEIFDAVAQHTRRRNAFS
jgi:hypothetical protein